VTGATPLSFDLATVVLIVGVVQGLFLSLLLLAGRGPEGRATRWLGLFLLSFSLMQVEDILYNSRALLRVPWLYDTLSLLIFALGPSLYLYARVLSQPERRLSRWEGLHFAPLALLVAFSVPSFLASRAEKLAALEADYAAGAFYFNVGIVVPALQVLVYLLLMAVVLAEHRRRIRGRYSSLAGLDLKWLTWLWGVNLLLWGLWVTLFALRSEPGLGLLNTAYTLFVYLCGYVGWRQGRLFREAVRQAEGEVPDGAAMPGSSPEVPAADTPPDDETASAAPPPAKYARSGLTPERRQALLQAVQRLMAAERLYRDPVLTLPKLARRLAVSPNHLSQALNEELGRTFFDFVNGHRVDEVKARLRDPASAHLTVLALALEAGFNSKSAFNAAFRRHTGTTPKAFRR
jgi:AraC-like DNA-binding protein